MTVRKRCSFHFIVQIAHDAGGCRCVVVSMALAFHKSPVNRNRFSFTSDTGSFNDHHPLRKRELEECGGGKQAVQKESFCSTGHHPYLLKLLLFSLHRTRRRFIKRPKNRKKVRRRLCLVLLEGFYRQVARTDNPCRLNTRKWDFNTGGVILASKITSEGKFKSARECDERWN